VVLFLQALFCEPAAPAAGLGAKLKGQLRAIQQQERCTRARRKAADQSWLKFYQRPAAGQERIAKLPGDYSSEAGEVLEIRLGFYANWDENSYSSLEKHADQLTHVCPSG